MNSSKDICARLIRNGVYFWDFDESTRFLEISESLVNLLGVENTVVPVSAIHDLIPQSYSEMLSREYYEREDKWYLPLTTRCGMQWFCVKKLKSYLDDRNVRHGAGVTNIVTPDEMETIVRDSGLNADAVTALVEAIPMLSDNETFKDGIHRLLANIYAHVKGSYIGVLQRTGINTFKRIDYIGRSPSLEDFDISKEDGSLISNFMRQLCEGRKVAVFDDTTEFDSEQWPQVSAFFHRNGINSGLVAPVVRNNGVVWGLVAVFSPDKMRWRDFDSQWISILTRLIDICLAQSQRNDNLREQITLNDIACQSSSIETWSWLCQEDILTRKNRTSQIVASKYFRRTMHQSDYNKFWKTVKELMAGSNESIDTFVRLRDPSSKAYRWHRIIGRVVQYDTQKRPQLVSGVLRDVDEEMRRHLVQKRADELQQSIYDKLPVGIEVFDAEGNVTYANNKMLDIYGMKRAKFFKLNLFDRPTIDESQKNIIKNLDLEEYTFSCDMTSLEGFTFSNGKTAIDMVIRISKLYERNRHRGYVATLVDNSLITTQSKKLSIFNNYWLEVGKFAGLGIFWKGAHDNNFASTQWKENLNTYDDWRAYSCSFYTNIFSEDLVVFRQKFQSLTSREINMLQLDVRVKHKDKTIHWVRVNFVRNDAIEGVTGLSLDITAQKNNEALLIQARDRAEKADLLKSQFIANISHEIRTPLNAIVGFSNLITQDDEEENKQQYAEIIRTNTDLLLKLISDILDLSKIESGTLELSYSMNNINKICSDIYNSLLIKAPKNIDFVFHQNIREVDTMAFCDSIRISQVLINFITNAFKFTHQGYVMFWFEISNNKIIFHVSDTGIGIKDEDIEHIFDSFVKLDAFAIGTGLGLPISKNLAVQMGGSIEVDSVYGKGSHFRLILPYLKDDTLPWKDALVQQKSIVVYSHDQDTLAFLSYSLESYKVVRAEIVDFFRVWLENKPTVTILDLRACEPTALNIIAGIQSYGNQYKIIILHSADSKIKERHIRDAEVDEIINMPVSHEIFMRILKKHL